MKKLVLYQKISKVVEPSIVPQTVATYIVLKSDGTDEKFAIAFDGNSLKENRTPLQLFTTYYKQINVITDATTRWSILQYSFLKYVKLWQQCLVRTHVFLVVLR